MAYEDPGAMPIEGGDVTAQSQYDWFVDLREAFEKQQRVLCAVVGDDDGVLDYGIVGADSLDVVANSPENLTIIVKLGKGFLDGVPFEKDTNETSSSLTAPTGAARIDTVTVVASTGLLHVIPGSEATSPSAPATPAGELKLAEIHWVVGATAIYDGPTTGQAYLVDSRTHLND